MASTAAAPAKSRDTATLTAYYWEAYNEIVQPSRINVYLIDKWLPDLGPVGFALVQALRRRCYHNPKTGETRNEILVEMKTLAAAIGVSDTTVHRELHRNEALKHFVKVAPQYETQGNGKAPKRFMPAFEIAMDDPIHSSDMERYDALRAQKEAERARAEEDRARAAQGSKYRVRGASTAAPQTKAPASASTPTAAPANDDARPVDSPKLQNAIKGFYEGESGQNDADLPKLQNAIKGYAKLQNEAPKLQSAPPKLQNEIDAPYISSSLFSLPDSLHAVSHASVTSDGASPAINSDPKGEEEVASGDAERGETFDPLLASWNVALGLLAARVNKPTMETHLRLLRVVSMSAGGAVTLAAPSAFSRDWVVKRHATDVEVALAEALGIPSVSVQIVVQGK